MKFFKLNIIILLFECHNNFKINALGYILNAVEKRSTINAINNLLNYKTKD